MKKIIIWGGKILRFLGVKDTSLVFEGMRNKKLSWIFKGINSRYFIVSSMIEEFIEDFELYNRSESKIKELKKGLDSASQKNIDDVLYNIDILIKNKHKKVIPFTDLKVDGDKKHIEIVRFLNDLGSRNPYNLSEPIYICATYYSKHGMHEIENVVEKLKGKDCIDCGAYTGDSASLFFNDFDFNKIFSIEPESKNFELLKKTIKNNNAEEKIIPLKYGLGSKDEILRISNNGITSTIQENDGEEIQITTIDKIVQNNSINPGFIKWDIEGFEYESILGAEKTIKKFKPILNISIYHRGKDFFEIKPLLESWNLGYKFKVVRTKTCDPFIDTVLLCY